MNRKNTYVIILLTLLAVSCGVENNIKKGEKYLALGEYYDAGMQFKTAYSKTPAKERNKRGDLALKTANCFQRINSSQRAVASYQNAIRYKRANIDDRLTYARQLLRIGNYRSAQKEFEMILDSMPENILAKNGLLSAKNAPQWKKEGSKYTVKKQDFFNSHRADYSPMLSGDQYSTIYFTSTRNDATGDELSGITGTKPGDIFFSEKDEKGKWKKPEVVNGGVNTENDEGTPAFSPDGQTMYLTQCLADSDYPRYATIAKSKRADAAWGKAETLAITKDTLSSFAHPTISPDGSWMYFVSDMPGGQGGMDIWRVRITETGFGGVENVGPKINTPGNEMFPSFRPNGDLYFSSDGHPGMGGLDIFYATANSRGELEIVHPGYPLNSHGDDFGITFNGLKNEGFFSSNRSDTGRGWDKIYSFIYPEILQTVKGWVYEIDGYELPAALVYMVGDDGTNLKLNVKGDGSFEQKINPDVNYIFLATCKGYLNHKEELTVKPAENSEEYSLQFPLANISIPTLIENIHFDFDRATLKSESTTSLNKLVELLRENPNITIELSSHCDYRGSEKYNLRLSQKRAESVCNYLTEHEISPDRLTPVGYGKNRPKVIRRKLAEKYSWLKENDTLTQAFIERLPAEQQEICNQLNRRTEFLVLRTTYGLFDKDGKLKPMKKNAEKEATKEGDDELFFE